MKKLRTIVHFGGWQRLLNKLININTISILITLLVISISIGYSAFEKEIKITDTVANIRKQADIRITNINVSQSNRATATYTDYNINNIDVGVILPYSDSSITYKIEVTNIGSQDMGIYSIKNLPENLEYEITDYELKEKICDSNNVCNLGISKEFYITIKYKEDGFDTSKLTYALNPTFDFREYYTVTYTDITNNNYPNGVLKGDTLEVDFSDNAPSNIKVLVDEVEIEEYTYSNGVLTIENVMGNVEIQKGFEPVILTQYITDLYLPTKTVTNNGINYLVDANNSLMYDRYGGTVTSLTDGNLRYYGANPNNYIDIGDRDSSGNIILWRIIGVFETKYATDSLPCDTDSDSDGHFDNCASDKLVKIIRNDSIGNYSWDYTSSKSYDNNWSDATLQVMLNGAYYNSSTTKHYNNSTTATTVDFTSSGLSPLAQSKVENVLWSLGGLSSSSTAENYYQSYSNIYYKYERDTIVYSGRSTEWVGKIGLMYPSDYGYATDLSLCVDTTLNKYNSSTNSYACRTNDWLYNSPYQWTITPCSDIAFYVFNVYLVGRVDNYSVRSADYGSRPVLYLKSDVMMVGEGTTSDGVSYYVVE